MVCFATIRAARLVRGGLLNRRCPLASVVSLPHLVSYHSLPKWKRVHPSAIRSQRSLVEQQRGPAATTTNTFPIKQSPEGPATFVETLPLSLPRLYRYLNLQTFSRDEMECVFDRIRAGPSSTTATTAMVNETWQEQDTDQNCSSPDSADIELHRIDASQIQHYLLQRFDELQEESLASSSSSSAKIPRATRGTDDDYDGLLRQQQQRQEYSQEEATRFLQVFSDASTTTITSSSPTIKTYSVSRADFCRVLHTRASQIDVYQTWPITASMLLVGASVGVITPAMPFVVENLGLAPGQYGMVVSAFFFAKMVANVPSAIAVERHGRKRFMIHSLFLIAAGVGGIGLASSFEELCLCRLLAGLGVAALSTAGTMMIADLSTPLNRARTLAPVMSAFSAGTSLGPALGGYAVDHVGLNSTFYLVGMSYLGMAALNRVILRETQIRSMDFPWHNETNKNSNSNARRGGNGNGRLGPQVKKALGQWIPLMKEPQIRHIVTMYGFYSIALAGSQMTLLPLLLTDGNGLAMTATQVGQVYMGMSIVQVIATPVFARAVDRLGKAPAISGGCVLISIAMAMLPFCDDVTQLSACLLVWSMGSSMLSTAPIAYVSDKVDEKRRAQAIALLRTSGDVGFLIGAGGSGALADWTGSLDVAMQSCAGLLLTATTWFTFRQYLNAYDRAGKDGKIV
jgi:MFS family permease